MRALMTIVILFLMVGCGKKDSFIDDVSDWQLVWADEFDGDKLDPEKWEFEVNAQGGGNNELQYYTDRSQNCFIDNGVLVIRAIKETYTGPEGTREYTSARIRTKNKGDWKYGRFEVKAILPTGRGLWPAIWMLPTYWKYGGWAASGEIDIMEMLGHEPYKVYGTLHYGGEFPQNTHTGNSYSLSAGTFHDDYHLFAVEWEEKEIRWYVDDSLVQTQDEWYTTRGDYPAPFNQEFHLLLNVAVGGNWPGNPDASAKFPQEMRVDFVRVYQKNIK